MLLMHLEGQAGTTTERMTSLVIRYREVLEKRLAFIQEQASFKKDKRRSKLAGLITLMLVFLVFPLSHLLVSDLKETFFFIQPTILTLIITCLFGFGFFIFRRSSKPAGLTTLFLATLFALFTRYFITGNIGSTALSVSPTIQASVITLFIGIGILIFKLYISSKILGN